MTHDESIAAMTELHRLLAARPTLMTLDETIAAMTELHRRHLARIAELDLRVLSLERDRVAGNQPIDLADEPRTHVIDPHLGRF